MALDPLASYADVLRTSAWEAIWTPGLKLGVVSGGNRTPFNLNLGLLTVLVSVERSISFNVLKL